MQVSRLVVGGPAQIILTREAAKIIGCSMSNVRWLAKTGRLRSCVLGPRAFGFLKEDVEDYKEAQAVARARAQLEGRRGKGKLPMGFSPQ